MNTFRTVIPTSKFPFKISHKDRIMCLGSCFTENIGQFITNAKFPTLINPLGIIYNPMSICTAIKLILENTDIPESELISINDRFYHWDFHGDLSGESPNETSKLLSDSIKTSNKFLNEVDFLFITLGTANAFQLIEEYRIVANCHKYPNEKFNRVELTTDEMTGQLQKAISSLHLSNPDLNIVFTVSPVRHIRDGLINNQLSKAKLIQTVHQLCESNEAVHYFPSYELVMDDLRDYRFYKNDMIHVNDTGLAYIWDYFKQSFFTNQTISKIDRIMKINKDLEHKPFYPKSDQHQKFLKHLLAKISELEGDAIDFSQEKNKINDQIIS